MSDFGFFSSILLIVLVTPFFLVRIISPKIKIMLSKLSELEKKRVEVIFTVFLLIVAVGTSVFSDNEAPKKDVIASVDPKSDSLKAEELIPEMIVYSVDEHRFACLSKELFQEALLHLIKHEKTKFSAMFIDFRCTFITINLKFKIISIDRNLIEFVGPVSLRSDGLWTDKESVTIHPNIKN